MMMEPLETNGSCSNGGCSPGWGEQGSKQWEAGGAPKPGLIFVTGWFHRWLLAGR